MGRIVKPCTFQCQGGGTQIKFKIFVISLACQLDQSNQNMEFCSKINFSDNLRTGWEVKCVWANVSVVGRLVTTGSIIHGAVTIGPPRSGHPYPLKFNITLTSLGIILILSSVAWLSPGLPSALPSLITSLETGPGPLHDLESCIDHCPIMSEPPS